MMGELLDAGEPVVLWENTDVETTYMWQFLQQINNKYKLHLKTYDDLHAWSVKNIADFWGETWEFTGMQSATPFTKVLEPNAPMFPRPDFFQGSTLNFAYNLLYPSSTPDPSSVAIISVTESTIKEITWQELREQVIILATAMHAYGIRPYDRVAGFLGNHHNTVVAMLAATWIGAVWTGISADQGVNAVLDRLVQIKPAILFADNAVEHSGKTHEGFTKTKEIVDSLPTLKAVIVFETVPGAVKIDGINVVEGKAWTYKDFVESSSAKPKVDCTMFPPDHPVYILYSSGTTGIPKCIIHSAAGTLVQHKKEHVLQCDIHPQDRLFYITTCSWMMWHWLVSGLGSGATIVLFQGSPFKPHGALSVPKLLESLKVTHFGTSAAYLAVLEQNNCRPLESGVDLSALKAIYSTGSPLAPSTFKYVYDAFPKIINLGSITGGTDIISLFGAPSPMSPVIQGEIQVKGLGMDICAVDVSGSPSLQGEPGDLLCLQPFPSQPVGFWAVDGDDEKDLITITHGDQAINYNQKKYAASYFEKFPGVWHHGDFVRFSPKTGGITMLGRSDGVLNPSGVRFGSSEIYNVILKEFPTEVEDALCIGRMRVGDIDETVVLFLKMKEGFACDEAFKNKVRKAIEISHSRRHVPGIIDECFEIPKTTNDKKVEVAVKQILCGTDIKISASVANPGCLDWYRAWAKTH